MAGFQKAMSACAELKTAIGAGKLGKCEALLRDAKVPRVWRHSAGLHPRSPRAHPRWR